VWYNLKVSVEAELNRSRSLYEQTPICVGFFCQRNLTIYWAYQSLSLDRSLFTHPSFSSCFLDFPIFFGYVVILLRTSLLLPKSSAHTHSVTLTPCPTASLNLPPCLVSSQFFSFLPHTMYIYMYIHNRSLPNPPLPFPSSFWLHNHTNTHIPLTHTHRHTRSHTHTSTHPV